MVYKKYVKKRGKVFGPYYYESYRSGNSVKKIYIGDEKDYRKYLRNKSFVESSVEQPKKPAKPLKTRMIVGIFFLLLFFIGFLVFNESFKISVGEKTFSYFSLSPFSRITGAVTSEIYEGSNEGINLEVNNAPDVLGNSVSKNKNKRMDFDLQDSKLRLYFDLLNYSEFVEEAGGVLVNEGIINKEEIIKREVSENLEQEISKGIQDSGVFTTETTEEDLTDKSSTNQNQDNNEFDINNININKVKEEINNLDEDKIEEISLQSVIEA
ncbi:MAG: hypothetical protein AABX77_00785, partial [Nanoarchaeota archaeon]